jgi:hypothetical protein
VLADVLLGDLEIAEGEARIASSPLSPSGIWIGPPPAAADYTGTPADPAALQEFLGHFRLCEGKG